MVFTHQGVSCGGKRRNLIYRLHTVREDRSDIKSLQLNFFRDECIRWQPLYHHRLPRPLFSRNFISSLNAWMESWENWAHAHFALASLAFSLSSPVCVASLWCHPSWQEYAISTWLPLRPIDRSCVGSPWSVKIFNRPFLKLTSGNSNSLPFWISRSDFRNWMKSRPNSDPVYLTFSN